MCNILARRTACRWNAQHWHAAMGSARVFRRVCCDCCFVLHLAFLLGWPGIREFCRRHTKCDSPANTHIARTPLARHIPTNASYRQLSNSPESSSTFHRNRREITFPSFAPLFGDGGDILFSCVSQPILAPVSAAWQILMSVCMAAPRNRIRTRGQSFGSERENYFGCV